MRKFNYVFNRLVRADDDLPGMIAYCLYKKHKIEHIKEFNTKYGKDPTDEELQGFHSSSNENTLIDFYYSKADEMLVGFSNSVIDYSKPLIESDFAQNMPCKQNSFWYGVWQSVAGSFLFIIILGLLAVITSLASTTPKQVLENIFNVTITGK